MRAVLFYEWRAFRGPRCLPCVALPLLLVLAMQHAGGDALRLMPLLAAGPLLVAFSDMFDHMRDDVAGICHLSGIPMGTYLAAVCVFPVVWCLALSGADILLLPRPARAMLLGSHAITLVDQGVGMLATAVCGVQSLFLCADGTVGDRPKIGCVLAVALIQFGLGRMPAVAWSGIPLHLILATLCIPLTWWIMRTIMTRGFENHLTP